MQPPQSKIKLIVVLGPTATGKSDLAVFLAKKFNGEVVSADSRQVYHGLNIGTGKITKREMRGIPHHLLDIASPKRTVTVAQYKEHAQKAIEKINKRGKLPILCGGSGFYIDAVVNNISLPDVTPNVRFRKKFSRQPIEKLYEILQALDPERAATIDRKNPRRLVRALEIASVRGKVHALRTKPDTYETLFIGLTLPRATLEEKIRVRLKKRFRQSMIKEVLLLHTSGVSWRRLESLGLEYREIAEYLQKKTSRGDMQLHLATAIRQFAKRQMTWFRRNKNIQWFSPADRAKIATAVKSFLH